MELTRKRSTKRLKDPGNLFRKNPQSVNSRCKAIQILGQMKAFYRQIIPEPSCAKKETVDIGILATSRNGEQKIMQSSE